MARRVGPEEKAEKKKVAFLRRSWQINPVTRGKESSKRYSRLCVKIFLNEQEIKIRSAKGQFAGGYH
jgi:hypothetical protein